MLKTVGVAKSTQKLNPTVPKGKGKYIMKLINRMEQIEKMAKERREIKDIM